jgi:hypothetical protein
MNDFLRNKMPIILGLTLSILGVFESFDWSTLFGHNTPLAGALTVGIGGLLMVLKPIYKMLITKK